MRVIVHCGVVAALLLSVALAAPQGDHEGHDHGPHTADHHHHLHHGEDEPHPQHEGQHSQMLSQPNADFAFTLYKKLSALPEQSNIFFSPLSISMALSMLALGAKGDTFSQLYQALGYAEMTPETVKEANEHMIHMFGHTQDNLKIEVGNAIVVTEKANVMDKFLEDTKHHYGSETLSVDFSKPDITVQEINKYIAQQTNNTITDMVKDVHPATLMMLINCLYFRGGWVRYFEEYLTKKDDFYVDENTKVTVDMMQRKGYYKLYEDKENFTTVLELPYKGSASMIIMMPDEGKMKEVEESMTQAHFKHWKQSLSGSTVIVHVPKLSISGTYSLKETLEGMGMASVFSDTADFSGMTSHKMTMSQVEHKAILNVDEKGTEAAAVTLIRLVGSSRVEPIIIKINRPFLVFITENTTDSILFMGKISDPTSK
ncbi:alpha-1-antitrypsin homolog [Alosa pseudoharengus]|uniref:alpha-1-antitrypsin homolog n=1 Tax=Alosa pseudoharengus TaxID=34774 RepID=UPI003F8B6C90